MAQAVDASDSSLPRARDRKGVGPAVGETPTGSQREPRRQSNADEPGLWFPPPLPSDRGSQGKFTDPRAPVSPPVRGWNQPQSRAAGRGKRPSAPVRSASHASCLLQIPLDAPPQQLRQTPARFSRALNSPGSSMKCRSPGPAPEIPIQ